MNDSVAGWANRNKVMDWINLVTAPDRRQGHDVMNMDKTVSDRPEPFSEVYAADLAPMAVMGNASSTCQGVTFIGIHNDFPFCTFGKSGRD